MITEGVIGRVSLRVRRSLTIKQMAVVSGVATVFIFVFIVIQLFYFVQQHRNETVARMESMVHSVQVPLAQAILKADISQTEEVINTLRPAGLLSRIDIVLPEQFQALGVNFMPEGHIPRLVTRLFELPVRISQPLYMPGQAGNLKPLAYLVLQADSQHIYQFILSTLSILLTAYLLLVLILTVSISWSVNRLLIHPVRRIAHELDSVNPQNAATHQLQMPEFHQDDEIGMLVRSYNRNHQQSQENNHGQASWNGSEFAIWLQPQVNMQSGNIIGAQVFIHQQQADGGWCLPEEFMGRIENKHLIVTIGSWVLEEACQVLSAWQQHGIMLPLSVNLSVLQVMHREMIPALLNLLEKYQVKPEMLTIAITESHHIDDPQATANILRSLYEVGVRIALDDFGMGYVCLRDLCHMQFAPVDIIKIDKCLIERLPVDSVMTDMIVTMANTLGLHIVAEDVENEQQKAWLLSHGVVHAQGSLFGQPQSVAQFESCYLDALRRHL